MKKEYESPEMEVYEFEATDEVMDTCTTDNFGECIGDMTDVCVLDGTSGCILDGVCVGDVPVSNV